jgi:hypothetical protein
MSTPEKALVWRNRARFMVVVHGEQTASDAEWAAMLDDFLSEPSGARVLVYAGGSGAPNVQQRVRLTGVLRQRRGLVAVLTRSPLVRAVGLALRVFRPEISVFALTDVEGALDYLGAAPNERAELLRTLTELKAELGLPD